jgi:hypothetical protein
LSSVIIQIIRYYGKELKHSKFSNETFYDKLKLTKYSKSIILFNKLNLQNVSGFKHKPTFLEGRIEKLRWLIAIPFILIGSILTATTVEDISYLGNITIKIIGFGFIAIAASFVRNKQEQPNALNNNRYK